MNDRTSTKPQAETNAPGAALLPAYRHRTGTGPTLVFLHYWGGSARTWAKVIDELPGRDVLTIDFRGWGRSRSLSGPFSIRQLAEDTLGVITDAGLSDFVLVGHSMGGKVSQIVGALQPEGLRSLVLVAPAPAKPADAVTEEYCESLSHAYESDETTSMARDEILTANPLSDALKAQVLEDSQASSPGAATEWPLRGIAEDVTQEAEHVSVPVLILGGENDVVEPVEVLRTNLLPYLLHSTLEVIPRTGHLIPLEAPDSLAEAIIRFAPSAVAATE